MASNTQGIQQLLTAEKRAAEKVSEARKRKNRRLKQAKEEAQAEIERYKAEREGQFREHEARYAGSKGDFFEIYKNLSLIFKKGAIQGQVWFNIALILDMI